MSPLLAMLLTTMLVQQVMKAARCCADHLKVTIPTGFAVSRLAWMCNYHKDTLKNVRFDPNDSGISDFGSFEGTRKNSDLFASRSMFGWCKREVAWGAKWLQQAHFSQNGQTTGIAIQVRRAHDSCSEVCSRQPQKAHMYTFWLIVLNLRKRQPRSVSLQCGLAGNDFPNYLNAEKIPGGPIARPCTIATGGARSAADHAGSMAAGLAAAAALVRDDADSTAAERATAATWLSSSRAVVAWGQANPGVAKDWFPDVRALAASAAPLCSVRHSGVVVHTRSVRCCMSGT